MCAIIKLNFLIAYIPTAPLTWSWTDSTQYNHPHSTSARVVVIAALSQEILLAHDYRRYHVGYLAARTAFRRVVIEGNLRTR